MKISQINEKLLMEDIESKSRKLAKKLGTDYKEIMQYVQKIDQKSKSTDVMKFNTVDELRKFAEGLVSSTDVKKRGIFDEKKYSGIERVYNDENFAIYRPKQFKDMQILGANTKWCVTVREEWLSYKGIYTFYVIINKNLDPEDFRYKICATVMDRKGIIVVWLKDNSKSTKLYLQSIGVPIDKLVYDEKTAYNPESLRPGEPPVQEFSKTWVKDMNIRAVDEMFARGYDVNFQTEQDGSTGLMAMSYFNVVDRVKKYIKKGADLDIKSEIGNTALILASTQGSIESIRELLKAGADTDLQDRGGNTALMYAANYDYPEAVKLLLKAGADKNIKNNEGYTAYDLAKGEGWTDIMGLLEG